MTNHKEKTKQAYNKIAEEFNQRNFTPFWIEEFKDFTAALKDKKILEIGCGAGRDAEMFVQAGFDYTGLDISEKMLALARQRVPQAKLQIGDFYHLEFPHQSFDGFWAVASFLHAPKKDINSVISEAKRILKPEGIGFITLKEKTNLEEGFITPVKIPVARYFSFYTQEEFGKILTDQNFQIIKVVQKPEIEKDGSTTNWLCFLVKKL